MKAEEQISAVWPGQSYPRGATWDGAGVNFSLFSANATSVELCLFDPSGRHEIQRIELRERTDESWHAYLPEARPGLLYGFRVHGPYDPERGQRFNAHKLLIEPYAKHLQGPLIWRSGWLSPWLAPVVLRLSSVFGFSSPLAHLSGFGCWA